GTNQHLVADFQTAFAGEIAEGIHDHVIAEHNTCIGVLGWVADHQPDMVVKAYPVAEHDTRSGEGGREAHHGYAGGNAALAAEQVDAGIGG
ncbi:MAG: hypothetical protein ACK4ZS_06530, partial [Sulfurimicrobium sp.]